jgi:flagellar L-ring protein precursor FlgH
VDLNIPAGTEDHTSSRKFDGSLTFNGQRTFTDSITVSVVDRLPNGNLVVGGRSSRQIAGESVTTVLSGIVKPEDIAASNTVSSARVAYLSVFYETSGSSEAFQRDGWLSTILSILWPF